ncbi:MAG: tRNA lysidine(34) synthetase TilS [Bdellovibrionota bacterium]
MSEVWTALEHQIWKLLKEYNLEAKDEFILAVSGGLDSMVLLSVFLKLKPQAKITVAHYHHGNSGDKIQDEYRNRALAVVKEKVLCLGKVDVKFCSEKSSINLTSEELMRNSRWSYLRSLKTSSEVIATAHHLDDRLETILLKMIRGAGIDGILSFKVWNQEIFRPFLNISKVDLLKYAEDHKITWVEDPSNDEEHYLRNWLREKWLKDLDQKLSQGSTNLAKSLMRIVSELNESQVFELIFYPESESMALSRGWYESLSKSDQLRSLALFLKKHQIFSFTSGQLEEIRKRLDKNQKDITFEILSRKWVINASQIMLQ